MGAEAAEGVGLGGSAASKEPQIHTHHGKRGAGHKRGSSQEAQPGCSWPGRSPLWGLPAVSRGPWGWALGPHWPSLCVPFSQGPFLALIKEAPLRKVGGPGEPPGRVPGKLGGAPSSTASPRGAAIGAGSGVCWGRLQKAHRQPSDVGCQAGGGGQQPARLLGGPQGPVLSLGRPLQRGPRAPGPPGESFLTPLQEKRPGAPPEQLWVCCGCSTAALSAPPVLDTPSPSLCSAVQLADRLPCSSHRLSHGHCSHLGCCFDPQDRVTPCYYGKAGEPADPRREGGGGLAWPERGSWESLPFCAPKSLCIPPPLFGSGLGASHGLLV